MANYPIHRRCKDNDYMLGVTSSFYSDNAPRVRTFIFVMSFIKMQRAIFSVITDSRLPSAHHEMALRYEINCPSAVTAG